MQMKTIALTKLTLALFLFFSTGLRAEQALILGELGPIRISAEINVTLKGEAQRLLREQVSPLFSGSDGSLYGVFIKAKLADEEYGQAGNYNAKSWDVTLELRELEPKKRRLATSSFPIRASAGGGIMRNMFPDADKYFSEYLARRSEIAIKQMMGLDQEKELDKLAAKMGGTRGIGVTNRIAAGAAAVVIGGAKVVAGVAEGAKDALSNPGTASALHQIASGGGTTGGQSVDDIARQNNREIQRIVEQKQREQRQQQQAESQAQQRYPQTQQSQPQQQVRQQAQQSEQQRQAYQREQQRLAQQQAALQRRQQQRAEAARQWSQQPGVSNQSESFSASSGAASSATKAECVARSESTGPKPNIPKQYCQYVFADYTDNVSFGLDDYSNEFMKESHSKESAKKALGFELLKKAKETCRAKGYSRVHHNETYEYNEVDVNVGQCKENNRMGSIFHLCGGTASFICARSD